MFVEGRQDRQSKWGGDLPILLWHRVTWSSQGWQAYHVTCPEQGRAESCEGVGKMVAEGWQRKRNREGVPVQEQVEVVGIEKPRAGNSLCSLRLSQPFESQETKGEVQVAATCATGARAAQLSPAMSWDPSPSREPAWGCGRGGTL